MFSWLKRKPRIPAFDGPRWPSATGAFWWMHQRVEYYLKYFPYDAHNLFDPSSADYMPLAVHVGSVWNQSRQIEYREVKAQYPQLVEKAKQSFKLNGQYNQSRVGDLEDFDLSVRLLP